MKIDFTNPTTKLLTTLHRLSLYKSNQTQIIIDFEDYQTLVRNLLGLNNDK